MPINLSLNLKDISRLFFEIDFRSLWNSFHNLWNKFLTREFEVVGQFVFALDQLVFRFQPLAYTENYLRQSFLDLWAGRYLPTTDNPGDPEQKQTDPLPFSTTIFDLRYKSR